jgi:hypothetical protein
MFVGEILQVPDTVTTPTTTAEGTNKITPSSSDALTSTGRVVGVRNACQHAIRMSAYNTESTLARLLRPHYARGQDEARALLREAFTLTGDLQIIGDTLHVRLDPATAPRRSRALAALCVPRR